VKLVVSQCPYCDQVTAFLDCLAPRFTLAANRRSGGLCGHVAILSCGLDVHRKSGRTVKERSGAWIWIRGGRGVKKNQNNSVSRYADLIACGLVSEHDLPTVPFQVGGGTAMERDEIHVGSGEFQLPPRGSLFGTLDAWGLYAENPKALVREIRRLAGVA
jgi:hypothetical protein